MNTQLIQYAILASCILFYMHDLLKKADRFFDNELKQAEQYIMNSERENVPHALTANTMVETMIKKATCRHRQRAANQLLILWRAKFKHLFKSNYERD